MDQLNPTILILTEHGLNQNNLHSTSVKGYKLITDFSRNNHKLGGVALYVNETAGIEVEDVDIAEYCTELQCEAVVAKIKVKNNLFMYWEFTDLQEDKANKQSR